MLMTMKTLNIEPQQGGGQTEEQFITPLYQVGEEILARRLPSTRIETEGEESEMICWVDENIVGRCWAAENEEEEE